MLESAFLASFPPVYTTRILATGTFRDLNQSTLVTLTSVHFVMNMAVMNLLRSVLLRSSSNHVASALAAAINHSVRVTHYLLISNSIAIKNFAFHLLRTNKVL